jgi:hypothetical protein
VAGVVAGAGSVVAGVAVGFGIPTVGGRVSRKFLNRT